MVKSTLELTRTDRVRVASLGPPALLVMLALLAQQASAQGKGPSHGTPVIGPGEAVITVHGFCDDMAVSSSSAPVTALSGDRLKNARACDTVITRAQFDKLAEALEPEMPLPLRLKVASAYVHMMRMAAAAEKRGLDKTAAFNEQLRYARLQLLSQDLTRALQEEAQNISDADFADYYDKHRGSFERATLERIFVPGAGREGSPAGDGADLAELALALRARAVAGERPEVLQVEAFKAAGQAVADVHTKMENVLRDSLPPSHERVMDLRVGDVSEVLSDPGGGHFIYKMISKDTPSLESVAPEIRKLISSQRYRDSLQGFEGDVVFNDAYFDPPGTRQDRVGGSRRPRGTRRGR
jgi:hypothetical protein